MFGQHAVSFENITLKHPLDDHPLAFAEQIRQCPLIGNLRDARTIAQGKAGLQAINADRAFFYQPAKTQALTLLLGIGNFRGAVKQHDITVQRIQHQIACQP